MTTMELPALVSIMAALLIVGVAWAFIVEAISVFRAVQAARRRRARRALRGG